MNTLNMTHEEWLESRRAGIGGSDAGAICGVNPYRSPIDVWMDKTNPIAEKPDNEAMRLGRDLEDYVAKRFTEKTGLKVRRKNEILQSEQFPFMLANVDRVVTGENAILECKTVSPYNAYLWSDGNCPPSYEVQCHHYMAVTGAAKVYLAALILGSDFVIVEIPRDEEIIKNLTQIESEFWNNHVITGEMPAPDGSKSATESIKLLYPESSVDTEVDLSEMQKQLDRYDEIVRLEKQLSTEKDSLKQQFMLNMEDSETAYVGDRKITWKSTKGKTSFDSKKLKEDMPELYEKYIKHGKPSRTFRIW